MKIKHVLMTLALTAATLTATGQTVTTDTGASYVPADLAANTLSNATTLTISGEWTASQVDKLRTAIAGSIAGSNAVLTTVTFDADAVMGSMKYLFRNCTALTGVMMPTAENSAAVSFYYAFNGCTALAGTVSLSGFTAISDMTSAFNGCAALEGVTMPATNTAPANGVTFYKAFYGCKMLAGTVNLSAFAAISDMSDAFRNCEKLQGVTLPTAANNTAVSFSQAFYGCKALTGTVNLSGFTNIPNMLSAFYGCAALEGVTMPTVENNTAVSFSQAFYGCKALAGTVSLSAFTAISNMMSAFNGCAALEGVTLPTAPNPVAVSFMNAFNGCKALQSVDLSVFTAISNMQSAFNGCTALEGVTLPAANTAPSSGINFSGAFDGCTALTGTVDVSGFTAISYMSYAFYGCTGITGVKFSATENTAAGNFNSAFEGCTALQSVDLSKFTAISNMTSTFSGCTALTSVKLGGALPATTIGAFSNVNYNCLVYVPAEWGAKPSGWYNIVYIPGGTAEGNIILQDNKPFHCPEAFSLGAGNTMSYTREQLPRNQWATVCLPFTAAVPADCIAKELSGSTETSVTFAEVQTMQANKPYIVAYTGSGIMQDVTFTSEAAVTIEATPAAIETEPANASYKMAGTYEDIQERSMYLLGDNSFLLYNHGNLHPFRAYITATGGAPNQAPRLAIGNEGGATGIGCIESPEAEAIPAISYVYTIDGRLVKTVPAEEYSTLKQGLERGIYIVNGKKVTVTE